MAEPNEQAEQLFSSCVFTFIQSKELSETVIKELSESAQKFGGEVMEPRRGRSISLERITHIISNTIDFPEFAEAQAMMIPVVKSGWISVSLLKNKQAQIRPHSPDPRMIFANVTLTCADIPSTDKEAIIGATLAMGGVDSDNLSKVTTHICALTMDHPKCQTAVAKGLKCKIVLPHWFDDCFKLGKRIDEGPYLLPDPEIIRKRPEDDVAVPSSQHLQGATSATPDYMPVPDQSTQGARPKLTVFNDKKVMISWDLQINDRLKGILKGLIQGGGGDMTESVEDCDMFVCRYRDGPHYIQASHAGKHVGNLSWLYHLITHNEWTSPTRRLLHYPVPRDGIKGFKGLKITVSNYGGEARIYLENLITATGATFTKSMKADNSHLITARSGSEKCEAAKDWNIEMVNHLWIEESYAKCEMQALSVAKYTHFPPRTNLGEIIGQTPFDESKLRDLYYPGGPEKPSPARTRKRKSHEIAQENSNSDGPAEGVAIGRQARKAFDVMKDTSADFSDKTTEESGDLAPAAKRRATTDFATPARKGRHVRVGKENETPSTVSSSTSRSAKDKALNRISGLAPDIALYEKEKKRAAKDGHGPWGGKRAADLIDRENLNRTNLSSPSMEGEKEGSVVSRRPAKKAKPSIKDVEMRIILTGFKRWVNDKHREDADRRKLRGLGIAVVADGQKCDYLVAPQMVRTVKFLRNLSKGAIVLSSSWVEECLDTGEVPSPEEYLLKDKENEKRFGVKLQTSVDKAKKNRGKLLWNVPVYCTGGIKNGAESYKAIADANGAIFNVFSARSGSTIKATKPEDDPNPGEPVYLLSTTSLDERKIWPKFEAMARQGNMEPRIVASDWLLDVAMKQELFWDDKYLVKNFFGLS